MPIVFKRNGEVAFASDDPLTAFAYAQSVGTLDRVEVSRATPCSGGGFWAQFRYADGERCLTQWDGLPALLDELYLSNLTHFTVSTSFMLLEELQALTTHDLLLLDRGVTFASTSHNFDHEPAETSCHVSNV